MLRNSTHLAKSKDAGIGKYIPLNERLALRENSIITDSLRLSTNSRKIKDWKMSLISHEGSKKKY